jgi:hypothetical protein
MRKRWALRNFNRSKFSFVRMEYANKECFVHQKAPIFCVRPKFSGWPRRRMGFGKLQQSIF